MGCAEPPPATACSRRSSAKRSAHDDNQEDDLEQSKRFKSHSPTTASLRFACPFFRHDPRKYGARRGCLGPGWSTARRVKEHLFRNHCQAPFCRRCGQEFENQSLLDEHAMRPEPCQRSQCPLPEGITRAQEDMLRSRRGLKDKTEEQKWISIYQVLFPEEQVVPSPYYDSAHDSGETKWSTDVNVIIHAYEDHLKKELPSAIAEALHASLPCGPGRLPDLEKIISKVLESCFANARAALLNLTDCDLKTPLTGQAESLRQSEQDEYLRPPDLYPTTISTSLEHDSAFSVLDVEWSEVLMLQPWLGNEPATGGRGLLDFDDIVAQQPAANEVVVKSASMLELTHP